MFSSFGSSTCTSKHSFDVSFLIPFFGNVSCVGFCCVHMSYTDLAHVLPCVCALVLAVDSLLVKAVPSLLAVLLVVVLLHPQPLQTVCTRRVRMTSTTKCDSSDLRKAQVVFAGARFPSLSGASDLCEVREEEKWVYEVLPYSITTFQWAFKFKLYYLLCWCAASDQNIVLNSLSRLCLPYCL